MGAQIDRSQKVRFYFGNAVEDLAHLLPPENVSEVSAEMHEIHGLLEATSEALLEIQDNRRKLSFLIADLKRILD